MVTAICDGSVGRPDGFADSGALYEPSDWTIQKKSALLLAYIFDGFAAWGIRQHDMIIVYYIQPSSRCLGTSLLRIPT